MKITYEIIRGFGLSFVFPRRQMGFEPIVMIVIGCFLICYTPRQNRY